MSHFLQKYSIEEIHMIKIAYEKNISTTVENLMTLLMNHKMNQEDRVMENLIKNTIHTVKSLSEEELKKIILYPVEEKVYV